jgi:hypothetical protein
MLKSEFDKNLLKGNHEGIKAYVIELDHAPQIVCSVGFTPEIDFGGNRLQSLDFPEKYVDVCTFSIINTRQGGAIVFAWLMDMNGACSRLIDSLEQIKTHLVPNAVVRLAFEHGENIFFSKSWWESLDESTRKKLEDRANSMEDKADNVLMDDGVRSVMWSVKSRSRY